MIYTTKNLPSDGVVSAFVTATAVTWRDDVDGPYTEEHGWVTPRYSMRDLHESRNDVAPYAQLDIRRGTELIDGCELTPGLDYDEQDHDAADFIRLALAELFGTVGHEDNGDGTWYGSDAIVTDYADERTFTYAMHFHVKHYDSARGWVEDAVTL